jgi:hypothetical protein
MSVLNIQRYVFQIHYASAVMRILYNIQLAPLRIHDAATTGIVYHITLSKIWKFGLSADAITAFGSYLRYVYNIIYNRQFYKRSRRILQHNINRTKLMYGRLRSARYECVCVDKRAINEFIVYGGLTWKIEKKIVI